MSLAELDALFGSIFQQAEEEAAQKETIKHNPPEASSPAKRNKPTIKVHS